MKTTEILRRVALTHRASLIRPSESLTSMHHKPARSRWLDERDTTRQPLRVDHPPDRPVGSAIVGVPREDTNSQLAHQYLLHKRRSGRIDLYFLGDSITRRWGCTDPTYAHLLEHWRTEFHGWNAGNFGWGGDRLEHMLWRIEHGELAGVHPKVIVLLGGTNNLDAQWLRPSERSSHDELASDILARHDALSAACRRCAPEAVVVNVSIFARSDNPPRWPVIQRINLGLQERANGTDTRYLDVNRRLADTQGRLRDVFTCDGLHLELPGYEAWAEELRPVLRELLGERGSEDLAPPPTGNPSAGPAPRENS